MPVAVRAVIVEAHFFSRVARLRAEDGRSLVLTRHAAGFDEVELRTGATLTCEIALPLPCVLAVRPCNDLPHCDAMPHDAHPTLRAQPRFSGSLRRSETMPPLRPSAEVRVV